MSGKLYQVQNGQKVDVTPRVAALTDVSSKADVTLGNLTTAGNAALVRATLPSGQNISLSLPINGGTVTAPGDGWIFLGGRSNVSSGLSKVAVKNNRSLLWGGGNVMNTNGVYIGGKVPCVAGDSINVVYERIDTSGQDFLFIFVYANGSAPQP